MTIAERSPCIRICRGKHCRKFEDTYELKGKIGQGAFGSVYHAKRKVIVEKDEELVAQLREGLTPLVISGDATRDDRLMAA